MARFDRQDTEASKVSTSLYAATGELESFVENQVREIIDAAVERAGQIEKEAAERAQEVRREAERKSEEMLEEAFTRAWRILDGIDLLENGVGDMIGALRVEMEGFAADLGSALPVDRPRLDSTSSAGDGRASAREDGVGST
jgi:BMFP domain-containing protein YqiC